MTDLYKQQIIDPGDAASQIARDICFHSHGNCPAVQVVAHEPGNFRGPIGYAWQPHVLESMLQNTPDDCVMLEEIENDGAGGKPQFFSLVGTPEVFRGLGWEIITMTADDFARSGRLPCVIVNALDVKQITTDNLPLFQAMMEGYGEALAKARLVNLTGEVAVMKHSITAFCDQGSNQQLILTWGATCTGLAHRDRLINPANITPNMVIVGFWEPGYRCNGGTFFTNLLLQRYGNDISQIQTNPEAMDFVRQLTIPSLSYARTVARLVGWNPDGSLAEPLATIAGIAHITGGGVWGKFGEILPDGVGAVLNTMPKPAKVLRTAQEFSWDIPGLRLTDAQAYGTLHGGCGMLFVCHDRDSAEAVIEEADKDGIRAQIVGHTTASPERELVIDSRFKQGRILSSLAREESS